MTNMKSDTLIYTFRTYPHIKQLREQFGEVFVFGILSEDIKILKSKIRGERPKYIIGIAHNRSTTVFEPIAINKFNYGSIIKDSDSELSLTSIDNFKSSPKPTKTFCNWTMYRIQAFINENAYQTNLIFLHLNDRDLPNLSRSLMDLTK